MNEKRKLAFLALLFLAPVVVAWYELPVAAAVGVVLLLLLGRWLIALSGIVVPEKTPEFVLSTISVSHFVEKVRWCMDHAGIEYAEKVTGGTLGAYFTGRTVPLLKVRTGHVLSTIGNSPDILRYLYGRLVAERPDEAEFLRPTPERAGLEQKLDRYAVNLQVWVYYHLLQNRALTLHAWGANNPATPRWQRPLLRLLFPLLARLIRFSFSVNDANYRKAVQRIDDLLADINSDLADGRSAILGDTDVNYTDFAFAAFTGVWLMPQAYGGGKADAVRIERAKTPEGMQRDIESWIEAYPAVVKHVEALYSNHRLRGGAS